MNLQEIREFKVGLLDMVHEQSTDPVPDLGAVKELVDRFCARLEEESGEEGEAGQARG